MNLIFKIFLIKAHQIITRYMMSSKSLNDFENKILHTPIAYGVSINLGFFGDDIGLLNSDWQSEFKNGDAKLLSTNQRLSFNYEIVPSKSNSNIISKHCNIYFFSILKLEFVYTLLCIILSRYSQPK